MAKIKIEKTPLELLTKAFQEDLNDTELQERYDRFVENLEHSKKKYNAVVPDINEAIQTKNALMSTIFTTVLHGVMPTETIEAYKKVSTKVDLLSSVIEKHQSSMDENEELIKKYKQGSRDKLFHWWKAFKAIDPKGTAPWLEWIRPYENKII